MRIQAGYLLAAGLGLREMLSFWTGHLDFEIWVRLGYYVAGGVDPYLPTSPVTGLSTFGFGVLSPIAYPPVWALMQGAVYDIYRTIGIDNRFVYYFLLKQETILPDIAVAYLLFRLLKDWGREIEGRFALAFWMLSPFPIVISAMWGMFDQLALMFVLLGLLLSNRRLVGPASQGIGIVLKVIPVLFLPALAGTWNSTRRRVTYVVIAVGLAGGLALLPYLFYWNWTLFSQFRVEAFSAGRVTNSVNYAVVLFVLNAYYGTPAWLFPPLTVLGYVWIPSVLLAYYVCMKGVPGRKFSAEHSILTLEFVTLVFFLTRLSLPEEYVLYLMAFGLLNRRMAAERGRRIFTGMWLCATGFLVADNSYLERFLAPSWSGAAALDQALGTGTLGYLRYGLMIATALGFSIFCLFYLRKVYSEVVRSKSSITLESDINGSAAPEKTPVGLNETQTSMAPTGLKDWATDRYRTKQ